MSVHKNCTSGFNAPLTRSKHALDEVADVAEHHSESFDGSCCTLQRLDLDALQDGILDAFAIENGPVVRSQHARGSPL